MADTRRRIVEAAIELHQTVGPARTSISDVAARAGVQRQTYYRHFPDDRALFTACTGLYLERAPLPDPEAWRETHGAEARLRRGLNELYGYYSANEPMFGNVIRDAEISPLVREMIDGGLASGAGGHGRGARRRAPGRLCAPARRPPSGARLQHVAHPRQALRAVSGRSRRADGVVRALREQVGRDASRTYSMAVERMVVANGVELCTEPFGDPADAPILLVMGIGSSMLWWDEDFCATLSDRRALRAPLRPSRHRPIGHLRARASRTTRARTWSPTPSACSTPTAFLLRTSSGSRRAGRSRSCWRSTSPSVSSRSY